MSDRRLVTPRGYALVTFASTAMIVAGVGLAWSGLLLAAAGVLLVVIEFKELRRLNPWLLPERGSAAEAPMLAPGPRRIARASRFSMAVAAGMALGVVQATGDPAAVIPPAIMAGLAELFFAAQLRRVLGSEQR